MCVQSTDMDYARMSTSHAASVWIAYAEVCLDFPSTDVVSTELRASTRNSDHFANAHYTAVYSAALCENTVQGISHDNGLLL